MIFNETHHQLLPIDHILIISIDPDHYIKIDLLQIDGTRTDGSNPEWLSSGSGQGRFFDRTELVESKLSHTGFMRSLRHKFLRHVI